MQAMLVAPCDQSLHQSQPSFDIHQLFVPFFSVFIGVGHRGHGAEAEEGADRSESLGQGPGGLPEPPVQRLVSDHQGKEKGSEQCDDWLVSDHEPSRPVGCWIRCVKVTLLALEQAPRVSIASQCRKPV